MYEAFFEYARERQSIFLKKTAGLSREEWTSDPILGYYKFCSIFREDDRTTIWLRENVRAKIRGPELLLATIIFRWFNRISTGEAIFTERDYLGDGETAWTHLLRDRSTDPLREAILKHCRGGPYVTGAYCIIGMPHMPKLDGILACVDNVMREPSPSLRIPGFESLHWMDMAEYLTKHHAHLEDVWDWFRRYPRSGDFMAYEIVTDLNHSDLMREAPDRMTWANAGPGAIRGLNRIHGRLLDCSAYSKEQTNREMHDILVASLLPQHWPQNHGEYLSSDSEVFISNLSPVRDQWPSWDMRTVEHTLCEFDKYCRIYHKEGRVKSVYGGYKR